MLKGKAPLSRLAQNVQTDTMNLAAMRLDGLPVSFDAVTLLDEVEFAGRRVIDVQELAAFICRDGPQFLKGQGHSCRLALVVVARTSAVDIRKVVTARRLWVVSILTNVFWLR